MKVGNAHFNQTHFTKNVNRSFTRAPGHAPCSDGSVAILSGFECRICGFRNMSKFHFNSHMNTHVIRQCRMCSYTARTAGQIQRHEKTSHTFEQHQTIGIEKFLLAEKVQTTSSLESIGPKTQTHRKGHTGAPKFYACKQCVHVSRTKEEKWYHARTHIPKQKQLTCTMCPFVTDVKHHLQYHVAGHTQFKAFKCAECEYTCATKSMVASHIKSHTSAYPYRCQDCAYRTKYGHSFKMHLALYNHRRLPQQPQPQPVPENTNSNEVEFNPGLLFGCNSMVPQMLSMQHHNLLQIALNLFQAQLNQLRIGKQTGG